MKKTTLLSCLLLVLFVSVLPAPEDKAEKLRHDGNNWDRNGQQFVVSMSCKFGIATAGEHADFKARTTLTIDTGENVYTATGERVIQKVEGADKDPDGYIEIEPTYIKWDSGDFEGSTTVTSSISLVGPSGNVQGDAIVTPPTIIEVIWPESLVKHDETGWEYDPSEGYIIVPLLAHPDKVDFLQNEGYQVTVEVDVSGDYLIGSGNGSAAIVKHDDQGWDYVQIQPALAVLDEGVSWNGDDDGSGIVSGTIGLVRPDGSVYSTTTFEEPEVWFVTHKPPPVN